MKNNKTVWRYLDCSKFLDLINNERIYFSRMDHFDDKLEGIWPGKSIVTKEEMDEYEDKGYDGGIALMKKPIEFRKNCTFVNCWHVNETESTAMWKLYSVYKDGLVIKSNKDKLIKLINEELNKQSGIRFKSEISEVDYMDLAKRPEKIDNLPCFVKHESYYYEQELRAVIIIEANIDNWINGLYLSIDVEELIDEIIVSPYAPNWFYKTLEDVMLKYSKNLKLSKSSMGKIFSDKLFFDQDLQKTCDINIKDIKDYMIFS